MHMKMYLDNTMKIELSKLIKWRLDELYKIDWLDKHDEEAYWIYLITPETPIKKVYNILSSAKSIRKKKFVIGLILQYNDKSFNKIKLYILRSILWILHYENYEILQNTDDLIFYLEEMAWKHNLIYNDYKPMSISETLEIIDKKNKKEEIEYGN